MIVKGRHCGRRRCPAQHVLGGPLTVLVGQAAGQEKDLSFQPRRPHGRPVSVAPLRRPGSSFAVHVCDPAVTQANEVLHGEPGAVDVVGSDHVDRSRP